MFISGFHASTKMIIEKSEDKVNLHIRKKSFGICGEGEKSTECVPGRRNLSTRKRIPLDMLPKCPLWLCFHPPGEHLRRIYLRRLQVDEKKNYFPTCRFLWLLSCEQDTYDTRHWGDKGKRLHNNLRQRASHREREMGRLNLIPFADHLPKKKYQMVTKLFSNTAACLQTLSILLFASNSSNCDFFFADI